MRLPARYVEILTGTLFSAPVYKTYGAIIADENYEPAGFKMTLGLKDIKLALAAAEHLSVPLPITQLGPRCASTSNRNFEDRKVLRAAPILSRPQWRRRRTPGILWILGGGI